MRETFKRTKILATIGPAVSRAETIEELIRAGVNGCRLNFSHGEYTERDEQIAWIRDASKKCNKTVAIVQDLQGPKIRLGVLKNNHLDIKIGDELVLDSALDEHDGGHHVPLQYNLAEKVKVGEPLYIFDGKVKTKVVEIVSGTAIKVRAENEGFIMSRKGLNLPETDFCGDILTSKDLADIEFGVTRDFDYVAISFVQSADDIDKLRQVLLSYGSDAQIIAKIETRHAIKDDKTMEEIVKATDGIMVARGDMAVEAGAEVVPIVQRKLIRLCRQHGKLCIVATQMMASMVDNPEPTRAEVSDVAAAVIQGADAVMLSDETANGKYPVQSVAAMKKVILYTQNGMAIEAEAGLNDNGTSETLDAISETAVKLAERIRADMLVTETKTGVTSATISANRPSMRIISVTDNPRVAQQLALTYANSSFVRPYSETYGIDLVKELKNSGYFQTKDSLTVVVAIGRQKDLVGGTDKIQVRTI
jgi:pyruvate kinase